MFLQRILRLTLLWFLADGLWTVSAEENQSSENLYIEADNEDMDSRRRAKKKGLKTGKTGKKAKKTGKTGKKAKKTRQLAKERMMAMARNRLKLKKRAKGIKRMNRRK